MINRKPHDIASAPGYSSGKWKLFCIPKGLVGIGCFYDDVMRIADENDSEVTKRLFQVLSWFDSKS